MTNMNLCDNFQLSVTPMLSTSGENLFQVELLRDNEIVMRRELSTQEYDLFMASLKPKERSAA
ncbi:MAG: hypothetical protein OEX12_05355 [Gammaproteobacteria bacterium]|nr:hypothetical protein [Gammaproteobacteria bacterium]